MELAKVQRTGSHMKCTAAKEAAISLTGLSSPESISLTLAAEDVEKTIAKAFVEATINDWIDC
jgi:hypothetical protein